MDVTQITSLLSAAAPYSGAITALAELGIDTEKLCAPDLAQKYDELYKTQLADFVATCAAPDSPDRADRLNAFVQQVCLRNGTPALGLPDDARIVLPLSHFLCLGNDALLAERNASINNELTLGAAKSAAAASSLSK
jgi:hypothetical protein